MTTDRLLTADVQTLALSADELDPTDVVRGDPMASSAELARTDGFEVGVWQLTEGQVTDTEVDEVFVVLSGSGHVEFDDGEVLPLTAGTAVRLCAGERTTWTITQTLRKIYVAAPEGAPTRTDDA